MKLFRHIRPAFFAVTMSLLCFALSQNAMAQKQPVEGKDYLTLSPERPSISSDHPGKVEVVEFFGYFCPHCNAFEPILDAWHTQEKDKIHLARVPVQFDPSLVPQAKLYYSLLAMDKVADIHPRVYAAIHGPGKLRLQTDAQVKEFIAGLKDRTGSALIDAQKFNAMYDAFGIQAKIAQSKKLEASYKIQSVPTVFIGGKYMTSPAMAGVATPEVMRFLVDKVIEEKKKAP